jgi:hypothetical protein
MSEVRRLSGQYPGSLLVVQLWKNDQPELPKEDLFA